MAEGGDSACYDLERFSLLMTAVGDDRLHTVRATASYSRETQGRFKEREGGMVRRRTRK